MQPIYFFEAADEGLFAADAGLFAATVLLLPGISCSKVMMCCLRVFLLESTARRQIYAACQLSNSMMLGKSATYVLNFGEQPANLR